MPVILARSAQHLAWTRDKMPYSCTAFHDGELCIKIDPNITHQKINIITATNAPAENVLELFFILEALAKQECTANIIFTYFGYARQDHPAPGIAPAAHAITTCLKKFSIDRTTIVHAHSNRLLNFIDFEQFIPFDLYARLVHELAIDVIVAPDRGAQNAGLRLSEQTKCVFAHIDKQRSTNEHIHTMSFHGTVRGKKALLFDDIVSTGLTLASAAHVLTQHGATHVYALATHGLVSTQTIKNIAAAPITQLYITNSVRQTVENKLFRVLDITQCLEELVEL